jgi:hypothetical protein
MGSLLTEDSERLSVFSLRKKKKKKKEKEKEKKKKKKKKKKEKKKKRNTSTNSQFQQVAATNLLLQSQIASQTLKHERWINP